MDYKSFLQRLKEHTGYDFCDYTDNSINRRLEKICTESKLSLEDILAKVTSDKNYLYRLVDDITVNTTELLRDPAVWVSLYGSLYKSLPKATITFWHIGCSVGLEVYSNIILLNELGLLDKCRIIGTDINPRVLDIARKGEYRYKFNLYFRDNFNKVKAELGFKSNFEDYFDIDEGNDVMRVKEKFRVKPHFYVQNLVQDKPPFAYRVDVVFLRNVMIYFNDALQSRIMNMVYGKLYAGGSIVFGRRETLPACMKNRFVNSGQYFTKLNQ